MERTLIEQSNKNDIVRVPLAARMRPTSLDEYVGQEEILSKGKGLGVAIEAGTAGSLILWGPPGVGKTSLAYIIAQKMDATVERVSAVASGVKELREIIARAVEWQKAGKRSVLIIDEIHRFNKAQQDVLLPVVEDGLLTIIGATTENPYFEVVAALISRAEVVQLKGLDDSAVEKIVNASLIDNVRGLKGKVRLSKEGKQTLIAIAGGDARRALNILEKVETNNIGKAGKVNVSKGDIEALAQKSVVQYDKAGDVHYDTISAFIKSMRGSDADATLFYLFRMLVAGEDPKFIVRRMFVFASEDIGNADPHALMLVAASSQALEWVGLPEAEFALAHVATYLAVAPKSNSVYLAMALAKQDVEMHGNASPPGHITNAPIEGMKKHGKGVGYKYPHNFSEHVVKQNYRPAIVQSNTYYQPGELGFEKEVKKRMERVKELMDKKKDAG